MPRTRLLTCCSRRLIAGGLAVGALLLAGADGATARVVADGTPDNPGSTRLTFTVEGGCGGAPTTEVAVTLPAAIAEVQPSAPPGWTVDRRGGALVWQGGPLPDDQALGFTVTARVPGMVGDAVPFPVVQRCGATEQRSTAAVELQVSYLPDPPPVPTTAATTATSAEPPAATVGQVTDVGLLQREDDRARWPLVLVGLVVAGLAIAVVAAGLTRRNGMGGPS